MSTTLWKNLARWITAGALLTFAVGCAPEVEEEGVEEGIGVEEEVEEEGIVEEEEVEEEGE
ncbi:hypothetical protein H6G00_06420 [Leptolyngbya sp. FACHB-541]|uniref:hypothetical protein n=1 Tax=Leptolyngbya sp. FACHB-541 TaxID=2692810 RepID=UPI00168467BA|nr:hypothetical protein [Leptolyngbya sp. FACHB-541]MBD1996253.1 hypothetical protein [Leptolyngbya sp. FACHB-541]